MTARHLFAGLVCGFGLRVWYCRSGIAGTSVLEAWYCGSGIAGLQWPDPQSQTRKPAIPDPLDPGIQGSVGPSKDLKDLLGHPRICWA